MDLKEQVINLITRLLEASKEYEKITRKVSDELARFDKKELHILYQHDKDVKAILGEYEALYLRIQEEI